MPIVNPSPHQVKPWCNYATHRTTSDRRVAGSKRNRVIHNRSKQREYRQIEQWWQQR